MVKLFKDLIVTHQSRGKTKEAKPINTFFGYDTETFGGKCYLICRSDSQGNNAVCKIPFDAEQEAGLSMILEFLIGGENRRGSDKALRIFYNLNYDVRAILRWMTEESVSELYNKGKVMVSGYTITFLSKKLFRVVKNKRGVSFFDIAQFYGGSLDFNAKKYLGDKKVSSIDSKILGSSIVYWNDNYNEIVKYCIHDCYLTAKLAELFFNKLRESMDFVTRKPFSTGSISQEYFLKECFIPTVHEIPEEVLALHQDSYRGGRIELLQKGYFESVNAYDIKSAYPAVMRDLIDYGNGVWADTKFPSKECEAGIYRIKLDWFHDYIAPFPVVTEYGSIYPNGEYEVIVNEKELRFLDKYSEFGSYEVLDGWEFNSYRNEYPYREKIDYLFEKKESASDATEKLLYKLFINSIYGKTAQAIDQRDKDSKEVKKYSTGRLWNPVYCSRITALTRLKLLETAMPIIEDVIGFATDSIHTTATLSVPNQPKIGDFTAEELDAEGIFLMAGIRYLEGKSKMRGFSDKLNLREILEANGDESILPIDLERPITVYEALKFKDVSFDDMNIFKREARELNINGDVRRLWKGRFINAKEVLKKNYGSMPIHI